MNLLTLSISPFRKMYPPLVNRSCSSPVISTVGGLRRSLALFSASLGNSKGAVLNIFGARTQKMHSDQILWTGCSFFYYIGHPWFKLIQQVQQDGAAMFGCHPGRSAKTMLLFTFLLTFDFYFYTHNIGTDHL